MKNAIKLVVPCAALVFSSSVLAQTPGPWTPPQNVLQLSASGNVEVQQDMLSITLATTARAATQPPCRPQLKQALEPRWPRPARARSRASWMCAPAIST